MRINKNILVFVLFFLLNITIGYAGILPYKESYSQYETFQAEIRIDGILEDITVDNLELRSSQGLHVPTTFYLLKPKDYYFVYFVLPTEENYTFVIKDASYSKNGLLVKKDELHTFEVKPPLTLSVLPGAFLIDATDKRYVRLDLQLKNYNQPSDIKISSRFLEESFVLEDEKTVTLIINVQDLNFQQEAKEIEESLLVTYGNTGQTYKVPIWITQEIEPQTTSYKLHPKIAFVNPKPTGGYYDKIDLTLKYSESRSGEIKFQNIQNYPLYNIKFKLTGTFNDVVRLEYTTLSVLQPDAVGAIQLFVNEKPTPGTFSGNLTLTTESSTSSFPIYITIKGKEIKSEEETTTILQETTTTILPATTQPTTPVSTLIILALIALITLVVFVLKKKKIKLFPV